MARPIEDVDYLILGAGLAGLTLHRFLESASVAIVDARPGRYKIGESIIPELFADSALAPLAEGARTLPSFSPKQGSLYLGDDSVAAFPLPPADGRLSMHLRREELEGWLASQWRTPVLAERVTGLEVAAGIVHTDRRTFRVRHQILDCSGSARLVARARGDDQELWPSYSTWAYFDITRVADERFDAYLKRTGKAYARLDAGRGRRLGANEYAGWAPSGTTTVVRVRDGVFAWQIPLYQKTLLSFGVTSRHGPISEGDLRDIARDFSVPWFDLKPRRRDGREPYDRRHVCNRFSHTSSVVADERFVLLGDAASFGEPIYATGMAVAVNQALFVARSLNDGGWSEAKAADYTARWRRMGAASFEARRFAFVRESAAPGSAYADRGVEGTPFQLTFAANYGRILAGVREFAPADAFGSPHVTSATTHERTVAALRALLEPSARGAWVLSTAFPVQDGLQLAFSHPSRPELTVRLEPRAPGRAYFLEPIGLGLGYQSLPDGPYPMTPEAVQLLERIGDSIRANDRAWRDLFVPEPD